MSSTTPVHVKDISVSGPEQTQGGIWEFLQIPLSWTLFVKTYYRKTPITLLSNEEVPKFVPLQRLHTKLYLQEPFYGTLVVVKRKETKGVLLQSDRFHVSSESYEHQIYKTQLRD